MEVAVMWAMVGVWRGAAERGFFVMARCQQPRRRRRLTHARYRLDYRVQWQTDYSPTWYPAVNHRDALEEHDSLWPSKCIRLSGRVCAISVWIFQARASALHSVRGDGFIKLADRAECVLGSLLLICFCFKETAETSAEIQLALSTSPSSAPPHVLQRSCPPEQLSRLLTQAPLPNSPSLKDLFVYFLHNSHMYLYAEQVMGRFYHPLLSTLAAQNDKVSLCVAAEGLPGSRKTLAINLHRTARTKIQNPISLMFALAELQYGFGVFLPNSEKVLLGRRLEKATYNSQCECCWKANFKKSELVL